jgi:hypothetical protein
VEALKMFPYRVQTVHELLSVDGWSRLTYCQTLLSLVLRATIQNAVKRAQLCINSGGGHLSIIIFFKYNVTNFILSNKLLMKAEFFFFIYNKIATNSNYDGTFAPPCITVAL